MSSNATHYRDFGYNKNSRHHYGEYQKSGICTSCLGDGFKPCLDCDGDGYTLLDCDKCAGRGQVPSARNGWSIVWTKCTQCNPEQKEQPKNLQGKNKDRRVACGPCGTTGRSREPCEEIGCKTGYRYVTPRNLKEDVGFGSIDGLLKR